MAAASLRVMAVIWGSFVSGGSVRLSRPRMNLLGPTDLRGAGASALVSLVGLWRCAALATGGFEGRARLVAARAAGLLGSGPHASVLGTGGLAQNDDIEDVVGRTLRPRALASTSETLGFFIAGGVALLNFVGLTALRGQTIGKWATGLCIRRTDGEALSLSRALLRHLVAYPLSFLVLATVFLVADFPTAAMVAAAGFALTLAIGFVMAAFGANGRALHDVIADTMVIREDVRRGRRSR